MMASTTPLHCVVITVWISRYLITYSAGFKTDWYKTGAPITREFGVPSSKCRKIEY